jgi:hypothetical protein
VKGFSFVSALPFDPVAGAELEMKPAGSVCLLDMLGMIAVSAAPAPSMKACASARFGRWAFAWIKGTSARANLEG